MHLPKDPVMLLSVVNTKLRDQYSSLKELEAAFCVEEGLIAGQLAAIGYVYDENTNQFK